MKKFLLVLVFLVIYVLHQDFWFWRETRLFGRFVFGFLPVGLFYHACFSVAAAGFMWLLVRFAWPAHLESEVERAVERTSERGEEGA